MIEYPFAFIHISFIAYQNFVHIIRGMLFNVSDPISYICKSVTVIVSEFEAKRTHQRALKYKGQYY